MKIKRKPWSPTTWAKARKGSRQQVHAQAGVFMGMGSMWNVRLPVGRVEEVWGGCVEGKRGKESGHFLVSLAGLQGKTATLLSEAQIPCSPPPPQSRNGSDLAPSWVSSCSPEEGSTPSSLPQLQVPAHPPLCLCADPPPPPIEAVCSPSSGQNLSLDILGSYRGQCPQGPDSLILFACRPLLALPGPFLISVNKDFSQVRMSARHMFWLRVCPPGGPWWGPVSHLNCSRRQPREGSGWGEVWRALCQESGAWFLTLVLLGFCWVILWKSPPSLSIRAFNFSMRALDRIPYGLGAVKREKEERKGAQKG